jgi:hypothetical protein
MTVSVGEGVSEGDETVGTTVNVSVTASGGTEVPTGVPPQALKITPETNRQTGKKRILAPQKDFANFT